MPETEFDMKSIAKQMTMEVHITGMKIFRVRLWMGIQFFRIGAWIAGIGYKTMDETKGEENADT